MVVTTGAVSHALLQSNHHQQTNTNTYTASYNWTENADAGDINGAIKVWVSAQQTLGLCGMFFGVVSNVDGGGVSGRSWVWWKWRCWWWWYLWSPSSQGTAPWTWVRPCAWWTLRSAVTTRRSRWLSVSAGLLSTQPWWSRWHWSIECSWRWYPSVQKTTQVMINPLIHSIHTLFDNYRTLRLLCFWMFVLLVL